jgi:hypothetical protein
MKNRIAAISLIGLAAAIALPMGAAAQSADDKKWVAQCKKDNKDEGAPSADVLNKYCVCMNDKMDETEARTITEWERKNPAARKACEQESGWK